MQYDSRFDRITLRSTVKFFHVLQIRIYMEYTTKRVSIAKQLHKPSSHIDKEKTFLNFSYWPVIL